MALSFYYNHKKMTRLNSDFFEITYTVKTIEIERMGGSTSFVIMY